MMLREYGLRGGKLLCGDGVAKIEVNSVILADQ